MTAFPKYVRGFSKDQKSALGGGFNGSAQHIRQTSQLAFDISTGLVVGDKAPDFSLVTSMGEAHLIPGP